MTDLTNPYKAGDDRERDIAWQEGFDTARVAAPSDGLRERLTDALRRWYPESPHHPEAVASAIIAGGLLTPEATAPTADPGGLQRYRMDLDGYGYVEEPDPEGEWVKYEDIAARTADPGGLHTWAGHIDCDPDACTVARLARTSEWHVPARTADPGGLREAIAGVRMTHRQGDLHNYGWNDAVTACLRAFDAALTPEATAPGGER
jgi:hypothetical protein